MTESVKSLFETGLERYKAGEDAQTLIRVFQEVCELNPKNGVAWSCLAWLYLLDNQASKAHKAALKGVKLNQNAPQGRVNLALAMLEVGKTGVRKHIEIVQEQIEANPDIRRELLDSIEDGLNRKPDWKSLNRIKSWLF